MNLRQSLPILKAESDLSPRALQEFRKNFVGDDVNPLDTVSVGVDEQFKALPAHLGVQCRWADDPNSLPFDEDTEFCVYKKAYLIVRDKNTDLREEIDDYIDSLKEGRGEPPTHVRDIICGVEKRSAWKRVSRRTKRWIGSLLRPRAKTSGFCL